MALQYNTGPVLPASAAGLSTLFGSLPIGPDTSGTFVLTTFGLAVARADGTCVGIDRDRDALLDLTALAMPNIDAGVYLLPRPLQSVRRGDILMTPGTDPQPLFVLEVEDEARIAALDPIAGEFITYSPPINPFLNIAIVAFSMYDLLTRGGFGRGDGDGHGPGGRLRGLLPILLLMQSMQPPAATSAAPPAGAPTAAPPATNPLMLALALMSGEGNDLGEFLRSGRDPGDDGIGAELLLPLLLMSATAGGSLGSAAGGLNPLLLLMLFGGFDGFGGWGRREHRSPERVEVEVETPGGPGDGM